MREQQRSSPMPRDGWRSLARVGAAAGLGIGLLAAGGLTPPMLFWNASPSSPQGLYALVGGAPAPGDFVVAWPPREAAALAARRGYLASGLPLVKTVSAGIGQTVCALGPRITIDGRLVTFRRAADRAGRALPWWSGCRMLARDEWLLLGLADPGSFDSRYFGPVPAQRIVGRARLIWSA